MKRLLSVLLLALILSLGLISCGEEETEEEVDITPVIFSGSTHMQEFMNKVSYSYQDVKIDVYGIDTGNGIAALLQGDCDVAMAARPITAEELAEGADLGIEEILIGKDAIMIFVHVSNPVDGLTLEQLKGVYTGEITNWSELGGADLEIVPFSRDQVSGTANMFQELALDGEGYGQNVSFQDSYTELFNAMDKTPGGISFFGVGRYSDTLTPIALDGVLATPELIRSGEYPLIYNFNFYHRNDIRPEAKAVLDYMLTAEGLEYVTSAGYVAVK